MKPNKIGNVTNHANTSLLKNGSLPAEVTLETAPITSTLTPSVVASGLTIAANALMLTGFALRLWDKAKFPSENKNYQQFHIHKLISNSFDMENHIRQDAKECAGLSGIPAYHVNFQGFNNLTQVFRSQLIQQKEPDLTKLVQQYQSSFFTVPVHNKTIERFVDHLSKKLEQRMSQEKQKIDIAIRFSNETMPLSPACP